VEENISLGSLNRVFQRTTHGALPVVDAEQNLVGIVTRNDLKQALEENLKRNTKVSQIMSKSLIILTEDDNLHQAIISLHEHNIGRLLIVNRHNPKKLIGIMTRSDIINFEATKEIDEP
jgi:CIC family chloride channel protein